MPSFLEELPLLAENFALELQELLGTAKVANRAGEEQWKFEAHKLEDLLKQLLLGVKFYITRDRLVYTLCIYIYIICRFHHDISDH